MSERIPVEKCWEITARNLTGALMGYVIVLSRVVGREKLSEITSKMWGEGGRNFIPVIREAFNIPVEDAAGAGKLIAVATILGMGPEMEQQIVEETANRTVIRTTKCTFHERQKEFGIVGEVDCAIPDAAWCNEGLKAVNPNLKVTITKALSRGDPYCEHVIEIVE